MQTAPLVGCVHMQCSFSRLIPVSIPLLGIGDGINEEALVKVASDSRLFLAKDYQALTIMGIRVAITICQGKCYAKQMRCICAFSCSR